MKTIIVKGTFLQPQAAHFEGLLKDGKSVLTPVFFKAALGNKVEATIDGQPIGYVEDESFEIPKLYDAVLKGLGPDPLSFEVDIDCAETLEGGDYAAEKALIDFDIVPEWEVDKMIEVWESNRVMPPIIRDALVNWVANAERDRAPMPDVFYMDGNPSLDYSYMQDVMISALCGEGILLIGEKSTGKNVMYDNLAWFKCRSKLRIAMSADMDPDSVFGGKTTDNSAAEELNEDMAKAYMRIRTTSPDQLLRELTEETGSIEAAEKGLKELKEKAAKYDLLGKLSASMRITQNRAKIVDLAKNGGTLLLDEMNMAEANFLQSLVHSMLDGERCLVLPGGEGSIKLHENFILMGGMNPTGYAGTRELNEATDSRFAHFIIQMPENIESLLRANFPEDTKLKKKHFKACADLYKDFRAAAQSGRVTGKCLNIRGFVRALKNVEKYPECTRLGWRLRIQVTDSVNDPNEKLILEAMIRDKITF